MVEGRPYGEAARLLKAAEEALSDLAPDDWMEAFSAHPRIGERHGRQTTEGEALSAAEQSGVDSADEALTRELEEVNRRYEDRFGFTYIVRAAGRSGEELLSLAHRRLDNDPDTELVVAAAEQTEITLLRLRRMLCLPFLSVERHAIRADS
jgi:OHCU decarboxylase